MNKVRLDYILIALILLLTLLGMVTLYSASYLFALNHPDRFTSGGITPLKGNFIAFLIIIPAFLIIVLVIKMEWLKNGNFVAFVVLFTLFLNVCPLFPFFWKATHRPGIDAMRWIYFRVGSRELFHFQPSELIKIVLPLYLAHIINKNSERIDSFWYGPLPSFVLTGFFCLLVFLQGNFSETILIASSSMVICFAAGIRFRWFILATLIIALFAWLIISFDREGMRFQRIVSFFSREPSPPELRTQIDFSLEAIKSGGFWGKGIGQGMLKTRMPEVHGDFVFAAYVEEAGFLGVAFFLFLFGSFAWIGYLSASQSRDLFTQIFAFGLITYIVVQTMMNIMVVVKLIPTTGIPLPFVSSGGSSLFMTLAAASLLVNITRRNILSEDMGGQYAG